ncbi:hypothetical protein ACETK8_09555 [Brevundimonas staleyi]|uniref:Uncharacterized protein n=1 Tax=Brevundimonas staleyi TaxID=74326 RepID=A0ABW0FQ04_9CAUL
MAKRIIATTVLTLAIGSPALAQTAPLTNRDVIGDWTLVITPAERQGTTITVQMDDDDLPLTVRGQPTGRLTCTLRGDPADCRLRNGRLSLTTPGAARMVFDIAERTRTGFAGAVRLSVRFLPVGGHIGSVAMTRR